MNGKSRVRDEGLGELYQSHRWFGNCSLGFSSVSGILRLGRQAPSNVWRIPMARVQNFLSDESGVTAIEYALIASLIAVFIIVAVQYVGTQVSTVFTEVGASLK